MVVQYSYGRYTHSCIRVWQKKKTRQNDKFKKGPSFSKITAQTERLIFPQQSKIIESDNSQMRCKCYTRYKSNPIYQISQINCKLRNQTIIGNFDFAYFSQKIIQFHRDCRHLCKMGLLSGSIEWSTTHTGPFLVSASEPTLNGTLPHLYIYICVKRNIHEQKHILPNGHCLLAILYTLGNARAETGLQYTANKKR